MRKFKPETNFSSFTFSSLHYYPFSYFQLVQKLKFGLIKFFVRLLNADKLCVKNSSMNFRTVIGKVKWQTSHFSHNIYVTLVGDQSHFFVGMHWMFSRPKSFGQKQQKIALSVFGQMSQKGQIIVTAQEGFSMTLSNNNQLEIY